jgi:hypothetical protein
VHGIYLNPLDAGLSLAQASQSPASCYQLPLRRLGRHEFTDFVELDDGTTRLKATDMAFRLLGAYPAEDPVLNAKTSVDVDRFHVILRPRHVRDDHGCTRMVRVSVNCPCSHFLATALFLGNTATICDGAALRYVCVCYIAFLKSSSFTMLYLPKMARVSWPDIAIATRSGTPARTMFLTAVRRKSWNSFPLRLAALQAASQMR